MQKAINTIENAIYSYNPNEYFPVYRDGKLDNRADFIFYKLQKASDRFNKFMSQRIRNW